MASYLRCIVVVMKIECLCRVFMFGGEDFEDDRRGAKFNNTLPPISWQEQDDEAIIYHVVQ